MSHYELQFQTNIPCYEIKKTCHIVILIHCPVEP